MSDHVVLNPAQFTVEELRRAAEGASKALKPQLAVTLLKEKLGGTAGEALADLARSDRTDARARHAATLALAEFPAQRQVLELLRTSADPLVALAAAAALRDQ